MGLISNVLSITTSALEAKRQLYADLGVPLPGATYPTGTQPPVIVPSTTYPTTQLQPTPPIGPGGTIPIPSPVPGIPLPGGVPGTVTLPPITLPGGVIITPPSIPLPGTTQAQVPQTTTRTTRTQVLGVPVAQQTVTQQGVPALPAGPGVACPSGFHPNKSSYWTNAGFVARGTKCVRNRRRNPLNPRALDRAISRITSAKRASKKLGRVTIRKACA